jgi:hypothetical protein
MMADLHKHYYDASAPQDWPMTAPMLFLNACHRLRACGLKPFFSQGVGLPAAAAIFCLALPFGSCNLPSIRSFVNL